ncbi:uncharacterized protein BKA78DRAFT_308311 [Phyllosticta capitalensis]|uniref:uncharacterized protein n=1 Tax=Phyllosticta capitalensis TaxID=121624 RepID=UPI00312E872F
MAASDPGRTNGEATMSTVIPDDVLHIICEQIAKDQDFATLFNCVLTGRRLAEPAIKQLYRNHNVCTSFGGGDTENLEMAQQRLVVQKWAIVWRSILASTMQETMFPYARYVRSLDLRNLSYLLDDPKFGGTEVAKYFFSGRMSSFRSPKGNLKGTRLNTSAILDAVGDAIVDHAPSLEIVSGDVNGQELIKWAPKLSNLRSLELWSGNALEDPRVREAIIASCPKFCGLMFYQWHGKNVDEKMSAFIQGLATPSLRYFEVIGSSDIGEDTYQVLSSHGPTLTHLSLNLKVEQMQHLPLLRGCTAIEMLRLEVAFRGSWTFPSTEDLDTFRVGMSDWLSSCKKLRSLFVDKIEASAEFVMPVLLDDDIKLLALDLDSYNAASAQAKAFHQALSGQKHLERLRLDADPELMTRDDIDTFTDSIAEIHTLKSLRLTGVSDYFSDEHVIKLAENLPNLEEFFFTGLLVADSILPPLAKLRNLRLVSVSAISKFSASGLLDFARQLGPGNRNILVAVNCADASANLDEAELARINDALRENVDGKLEFTLWRDPDMTDFEGSDSD